MGVAEDTTALEVGKASVRSRINQDAIAGEPCKLARHEVAYVTAHRLSAVPSAAATLLAA